MITDRESTELTVQLPDVLGCSTGRSDQEVVVDADGIDSLVNQLAHAVVRKLAAAPDLAMIGIRRRGDVLAQRLQAKLAAQLGHDVPCGSLDITLYRDDFDSLTEQLIIGATDIPFAVQGSTLVLVDDVLFTGRTVRAALDEILELGRPVRIVLAVLIDRGWRELPIAPDLVGQTLVTQHADEVQVLLTETDGCDVVLLRRGGSDGHDQ